MRTIAIIQARLNSTRLPNKVLLKIGNKSRVLFGSVVIKNVKPDTTIFGNPGLEIAK